VINLQYPYFTKTDVSGQKIVTRKLHSWVWAMWPMPDKTVTSGKNADAGLTQLTTGQNVDAGLTLSRHSGIYLWFANITK
jgi:hypothetical protein